MVAKGNVLVVDDEINLCRILSAKLEKNGFDVVSVHDGVHAVEKVRSNDFDVVLLDLVLPQMDGLTALNEIRKTCSDIPVIIMTACENNEAVEQAMVSGANACLNKPFDLDKLVSMVQNTSRCAPAQAAKPQPSLLFAKGQPVLLEVLNGRIGVYGSAIKEKGDNDLVVYSPRTTDFVTNIPNRTKVKIGIGAKDAYYHFTTHVAAGKTDEDGDLVLEKPSVICRTQRRKHPRFDVCLPVQYALYDEDSEHEPEYVQATTKDLSAGGASILANEEVPAGEVISLKIRPEGSKEDIDTVAYVVRSERDELEGEEMYILGCRFSRVGEDLDILLSNA